MNILIATHSYILAMGLNYIIKRLNKLANIKIATTIQQFNSIFNHSKPDLLIIEHKILQKVKTKDCENIIILENDSQFIENKGFKHLNINAREKEILEILQDFVLKKQEKEEILSDREKEIVKLVAKGYTIKEIAEKLFISPHTVITHKKNISQKLGIKSIAGLTTYAILNGLIEP